MSTDYIKQRVGELFQYVEYLRDAANTDTVKANEIIAKTKENKDEEEGVELLKKFKKIQFFNNLKLSEMEKTMPILVELVSVAKVIGVELELTEEQELVIETNKKRNVPMYIIDKNELVFMHKELEAVVEKEINDPSPTELEALKKMLKAMGNG